jgi:hypothetical protein
MNWLMAGLWFVGGSVITLTVCGVWYRHNKKRLGKVLTFFDVQARIDELLEKTDVDDKIKAKVKEIRDKVDKII